MWPELLLQLHFAPDAREKDVEVFHRLKLYSDDDPTGQSKKPVVHVGASYDMRMWGQGSPLLAAGGKPAPPTRRPTAAAGQEAAAGVEGTASCPS